MAATRITNHSTGGETAFMLWEACPLSGIFQTVSSHATMEEARAAETELAPAAKVNLTWKEQDCPVFGHAFWLRGLKEGESASAHRRGPNSYYAHAFIGGRYLGHCARTMKSAMTRLEREIDKRSIGLLGVDDVTFAVQS